MGGKDKVVGPQVDNPSRNVKTRQGAKLLLLQGKLLPEICSGNLA